MEYIILLVSLVGIVFSADYLVAGSVSIARKFKVSDFVIGAVVVLYAFGKDCKIQRWEGAVLFLCFIGYTWYLISNQIA